MAVAQAAGGEGEGAQRGGGGAGRVSSAEEEASCEAPQRAGAPSAAGGRGGSRGSRGGSGCAEKPLYPDARRQLQGQGKASGA